MDAFLAQFANRPSASQDPSFFQSSSSSGSEPELEVRLKKTSKSKAKPKSSSGFIVDKTGENEIDIDEFISAIQREAKIQVGNPDLDGAFCTLKPSTKVATATAINAHSPKVC